MLTSKSTITTPSSTILGKRKATSNPEYVLHLVSSPEPPGATDSEFEPSEPEPSSKKQRVALNDSKPILLNGKLATCDTKKRYACTYDGCTKAYTKPSRLEEHERSHTGFRPFVCSTCSKSYLRETHLQAHSRIHLPDSQKPFICTESDCSKRFWTQQHLRAHLNWHSGAKPFLCDEDGCNEAFSKHNQLRTHKCTVHAPPGTKPYQCPHEGCTKSFATNQHLRTHSKVHNEKRYTCAQASCLEKGAVFYPTWTALQHHIRTEHPPTCLHPQCKGRKFASQKGLRAHQKLHEQREVEAALNVSDVEDGDTRPRKKRRGGEIGRDWRCEVEGCGKDFKSSKALGTHHKVTHLGRRDFVCPHGDCQATFGYKHLLQRHLTKIHPHCSSSGASDSNDESQSDGSDDSSPDDEVSDPEPRPRKEKATMDMSIDAITGLNYAAQARQKLKGFKALSCPFPNLDQILRSSQAETGASSASSSRASSCDYVFSRAYDLRRHLRAQHGTEADKSSIEEWVARRKASLRAS